jgi:hypothetical protein
MSEKTLNRRQALGLVATGAATAAVAGLAGVTPARAEFQPRMQMALAALQNARAHLMMGSADKGGHRVKAIVRVDQAIAQVNLAIAYDNIN